jgi:hypothetical protein
MSKRIPQTRGRSQQPGTRVIIIGGFLLLVLGLVAASILGSGGTASPVGSIDPTDAQQVALGEQV